MAQIFHRSTNTLSRVTIFGAVFMIGFVLWVIGGIVRSPYATDQGIARDYAAFRKDNRDKLKRYWLEVVILH